MSQIIKTVISVSLLALVYACAISKSEQQAREAGCYNTWNMQNNPWILSGADADVRLRAAEIENCSCSNGECRKR